MPKGKCTDCYHYDICNIKHYSDGSGYCNAFKNSSLIIELPCKVGDTVYVLVNWCDYTNCHFEGCAGCLNCNNKGIVERKFNYSMLEDFGKTVFLTKEEAEAKLKERKEI